MYGDVRKAYGRVAAAHELRRLGSTPVQRIKPRKPGNRAVQMQAKNQLGLLSIGKSDEFAKHLLGRHHTHRRDQHGTKADPDRATHRIARVVLAPAGPVGVGAIASGIRGTRVFASTPGGTKRTRKKFGPDQAVRKELAFTREYELAIHKGMNAKAIRAAAGNPIVGVHAPEAKPAAPQVDKKPTAEVTSTPAPTTGSSPEAPRPKVKTRGRKAAAIAAGAAATAAIGGGAYVYNRRKREAA